MKKIIIFLFILLSYKAHCLKLSAYFLPYTTYVNSKSRDSVLSLVIVLRFTNNSDAKFSFYGMSCRIEHVFRQGPGPFYIGMPDCDKNVLRLYELGPHEHVDFLQYMSIMDKSKTSKLTRVIEFCHIKESDLKIIDQHFPSNFYSLIKRKFQINKDIIKLNLSFNLWDIYFS
jgi:hypothetical protein